MASVLKHCLTEDYINGIEEMDEDKVQKCGAQTTISSERAELFWGIKDWRLCKHLTTEGSFESPPFQLLGNVWKIQLRADYVSVSIGTKNKSIQARLVLEKSSTNPIMISGSLRIDGVLETEFFDILSTKELQLPRKEAKSTIENNSIAEPKQNSFPSSGLASFNQNHGSKPQGIVHLHPFNQSITAKSPVAAKFDGKSANTSNFIETTWKSMCEIKKEDLNVIAKFRFSSGDPTTEMIESRTSASISTATPRNSGYDDTIDQMKKLSADLESLLAQDNLSDMIIAVNGTTVRAHRLLFSIRSPVFKEMIDKAIAKKRSLDFEIKCPNIRIWDEFHQFIYTGRTSITDQELLNLCQDLFPLARKFLVQSMIDYLTNRLLSIMNYHNALDMLELAYQHNLRELQKEGMDILMKNISEVKLENRTKLLSLVQNHADIAAMMIDK